MTFFPKQKGIHMTNISALSNAMNGYASESRYIAKMKEDKQRATGASDIASSTEKPGSKDTRTIGSINVVDATKREKDMRTAAEQFAGFFMGFMMKEMRKTVQITPFGHGSDSAERMFQELADEEYGNTAARANSNAITELVYRSLMNGARVSSR